MDALLYYDDDNDQALIGVPFTFEFEDDISASTVRKIYVKKPDGTRAIWPASGQCTLGADNKSFTYTSLDRDLDAGDGEYLCHPYIEGVDALEGWGNLAVFAIYKLFSR